MIEREEIATMITLSKTTALAHRIDYTGLRIFRTKYTYEVTGTTAAAIEAAERSSFYGVYGNTAQAAKALRAILSEAEDELPAQNPSWLGYSILSARSIREEGDRSPYCAEVVFEMESSAPPLEIC